MLSGFLRSAKTFLFFFSFSLFPITTTLTFTSQIALIGSVHVLHGSLTSGFIFLLFTFFSLFFGFTFFFFFNSTFLFTFLTNTKLFCAFSTTLFNTFFEVIQFRIVFLTLLEVSSYQSLKLFKIFFHTVLLEFIEVSHDDLRLNLFFFLETLRPSTY